MNLETCHGPAPKPPLEGWLTGRAASKGHFCRNGRCQYCGKMKQESVLRPHGSRRGEARFVCGSCGRVVEARDGTAYGPAPKTGRAASKGHLSGIRTDLEKYELGAKMHPLAPRRATFEGVFLAEGMSIRATARILNIDNGLSNGHLDTVCDKWPSEGPWVSQLGRHCADVAAYHFRNLHLTECQLDELWTFVYKKEDELTPIEYLQGVYGPAPKTGRAASEGHFGDAWVWKVALRGAIAFAPVRNTQPLERAARPSRGCKIVPVWVAGKRTLKDGRKLEVP